MIVSAEARRRRTSSVRSNRMAERQDAWPVMRFSVAREVPGRPANTPGLYCQQPFDPADLSATHRVGSAGFPSCAPGMARASPERRSRRWLRVRDARPPHASGDMPVRGPIFERSNALIRASGFASRIWWTAWNNPIAADTARPVADCTFLA
jgi:hypothetical protein